MLPKLFREPDGWRTGVAWIAIGLFFLGLYDYDRLVGQVATTSPLYFGVLWVLMGIPELLPTDRRRLAGGLRIIVLVFATVLLVFFLSQLSVF